MYIPYLWMFTLKSPEYIFMKCIQRQQNIAREGIQKDHYVTALFRMIYKKFLYAK